MGAHGGTFTRRVSCRCYCGYRRCCCCSYGARRCARTRTTVGRHGVTTRSQHRVVLSCPEVGRWPLGCSFSLTLGFFLQHVLSLFSLTFLFSFSFFLSLSSSYSLALSRARNETSATAAAFPCRPRIARSRRVTTYTFSRWPERALPGALSLAPRARKIRMRRDSQQRASENARLAPSARRVTIAAQFTAHSTETPQGHSTTTRHGKR